MEFQKDRLIELIESEFGLLDKLLSCGALTKPKIAKVKSGTTLYEKNEFLLNYILSENKHQDLMKALSDCGQHHVVNWVKGNGEYKEEFGLDWPLREAEEKVLDCNQEALVYLLNADELLLKLFSLGVFNPRQRESIGSESTVYERSEALLNAVRRLSLKSYFTFKECLRQSGQSHVADILENGGCIVPVHATLECKNLDEVETEVVNQMADVLMGRSSVEHADRLIAALQLKITGVRRGQSIVICTSCKKEVEFVHLCKIIGNLEMRNILEELFNQLIPNLKIKVLLVNVLSKDMEKAQKIFKDMKNSWNSNIRIGDLPLELIDIILLKSYLYAILRQRKSSQNRKDEVVIKLLASVDFCWFQRITRKRFKNVVLSKLKNRFPLMMVDFITELDFDRESKSSYSESHMFRVIDVTKLKMKIYVLCLIRSWGLKEDASLSTMICVFEDRSPYPTVEDILLRGFDISELKSIVSSDISAFMSIASSVKGNCLYLLKSSKKENHCEDEVIRVEIKGNEEKSLKQHSKWLELEGFHPSALFISKDGDLMMVDSFSSNTLRIYDSDAKLRLSVKLHEDILRTRKAVETANGNFIIRHTMERQTEDAVSEVSRDGKTIIRRFIPQNQQQQLHVPYVFDEGDLCTDSEGRIFVTDTDNERVIVLDSYLRWIGSFIPQVKNGDENEKLLRPLKLFYDEDSHKMIITEKHKVFIYDLICK